MNRIILIGNGFDLAHGMKTSYKQFIDSCWEECVKKILELATNTTYEDEEIIIESRNNQIKASNYKDFRDELVQQKAKLIFKNRFYKSISEKFNFRNWVDIENEYYTMLKYSIKYKQYNVTELNKDFNKLKDKLVEYLKEIVINFNNNLGEEFNKTREIIASKIYQPFKLKDFSESFLNKKVEIEYNLIKKDLDAFLEERIKKHQLEESKRKIIEKIGMENPLARIKKLLKSDSAIDYFDLIPSQTIFLNFNYTNTEDIYIRPNDFDWLDESKSPSVESIHIHGEIDRYNNPIIFGFGDEMDDDYKSIEKLNNNSYLENMKSINYLETDNYKKLLEYINSEYFQVFIFGHSCGISDRTLLNTIFEHENCASIKIFYHQKSEGIDNYSDIVRNISRNFNDKAKMRDRVVNKKYCERLT